MKDCWAYDLGDCYGKLTKEHIVTNSIIGKTVKVKGFSWCKNESKEIGSPSLVNKILCEKHNNELSVFDSEAKNFISVINNFCLNNDNFSKFGFRKKDLPIVHKIDGKNLERWCCKTLINVALSQTDEIIVAPEKILTFIFRDKNFEKPYGLNFAISVGQKINTNVFLEIRPLFNKKENFNKELAGGLFIFRGLYLIVLIPCSKDNLIIDNKLVLNLNNNEIEWNNLQLNWHNRRIDYSQPGKKLLMQRIKFNW